jgi:hypothetical protein
MANTDTPFTDIVISESIGKKIRPALLTALDVTMSEGERIAALNAVDRLLKSDNLDKFALVDTIGKIPTVDFKYAMEQQAEKIRAEERARAKRVVQQEIQAQAFMSTTPPWHQIALECRARRELREFTGRNGETVYEKEFVDDMVRRTEFGLEPTQKQQDWLRRIHARRPL